MISIVIVTYGGKKFPPTCLTALVRQICRNIKLILVDNGSEDNILDSIQDRFPSFEMRIERLKSNLGFAFGSNIGARLAQGKWIILLKADAYLKPDWLENLLVAAQTNPDFTAFSSRQIQFNTPDLLVGAGDSYHMTGLT